MFDWSLYVMKMKKMKGKEVFNKSFFFVGRKLNLFCSLITTVYLLYLSPRISSDIETTLGTERWRTLLWNKDSEKIIHRDHEYLVIINIVTNFIKFREY